MLRCAELSPSIHVCHRQEWDSSFLALGGFSFLNTLLNCSWWICIVLYPVDTSGLVSSWDSDSGDGGCAHYSSLRRTFF